MSTQRYHRSLIAAVLGVTAVAVATCFWLPDGRTPGATEPRSGDDEVATPVTAREAAAPATVVDRIALDAADEPRRAGGPLIFSGRIVQRDGRPLPPTEIFVDAPDRSLLSAGDQRRAKQSFDVPPDGRFRFVLPGDLYEDTAFVNIVGGHGDMTLLTGLAKVEENVTITVSGPDDPDAQPLTGTLIVAGEPVQGGDLLLLHQPTGEPISFQWGCEGNEIAVSLRVLKMRFADVLGPVVLRLDDAAGLHAAAVFSSCAQLSEQLATGFELKPDSVKVELPELRPGVEVQDASLWSRDNGRFPKREAVTEGVLELRLTPGEYRLRGANPVHGVHALSTFSYRGGDVEDLQWGYVAPGPHSCRLTLETPDGAPVTGAEISARLAHPEDPGVRPNWYSVSAESGADGGAHLPGLLAGTYRLHISHRDFAAQEVSLEVPRQLTARVILQATVSVAWQFSLPPGAAAVDRLSVFVRELTGRQPWVAHDLGPGSASGDYVLQALPGSYEVLCLGGRYLGRRSLRLDGARSFVARIEMDDAPVLAGRVVRGDGTPAAPVWLELISTETGTLHARSATDGSGAFEVASLAAHMGSETLVVMDAAGTVLAREAARDGMEIRIER